MQSTNKDSRSSGLLERHTRLASSLDAWFSGVRRKYAGRMQCGCGCARSCHGLFDISLGDALRITQGFVALPEPVKAEVVRRAAELHEGIVRCAPELHAPYLLGALSEERIDEIVDCPPRPRGPFLDENDRCLVYGRRPLACVLEGAPMVDVYEGPFGDWCELNFKRGLDQEIERDLRLDYDGIRAVEQELTKGISETLPAGRNPQHTVFIPSLIAAFKNGDVDGRTITLDLIVNLHAFA